MVGVPAGEADAQAGVDPCAGLGQQEHILLAFLPLGAAGSAAADIVPVE